MVRCSRYVWCSLDMYAVDVCCRFECATHRYEVYAVDRHHAEKLSYGMGELGQVGIREVAR